MWEAVVSTQSTGRTFFFSGTNVAMLCKNFANPTDVLRFVVMIIAMIGWIIIVVTWVDGPHLNGTNTTLLSVTITNTTLLQSLPLVGAIASVPTYVIFVLIFTCVKTEIRVVNWIFSAWIHLLGCATIFFSGAIVSNVYLTYTEDKWGSLAFSGALIVLGCSIFMSLTFLKTSWKYKKVGPTHV
eukprot:TRINITY_DN7412_c0_g2_i3.p1 TRINITY_DN7412_c0_g2~~TRINITY_DN7412_c0_g2_i3.p1  ORF type:complete len:184 (+),score=31.80 TRINITY_DN7412_c0_g2_i3:15-566(+)